MRRPGRDMAVAAAACALAGAAAPAALAGTATFAVEQAFTVAPTAQTTLALGLLDAGTDPDVVTSGSGRMAAIRGTTGTAFTGPWSQAAPATSGVSVVTADVDRDGRVDALTNLATSEGVFSVSRGLGNGAFAAPTPVPASGYHGHALGTGDFDQDGEPDVAVVGRPASSTTAGRLLIMRGGTGTTFSIAQSGATLRPGSVVEVGRLNADRDPDLVVTHPADNTVRVHFGATGAAFSAPQSVSVGTEPRDVAIGSLNADPYPDIALVTRFNLQILWGQSNRTFKVTTGADDYGVLRSVEIADVDGDGHDDVLVGNEGETDIHYGRSNGTFTGRQTVTHGARALSLKASDLDQDRDPDLVYVAGTQVRSIRNATPHANVGVKVVDAPDPATTTADLKYTISATNAGPATATGVTLTLTPPESTSVKTPPSGCTVGGFPTRVTCTIGSVSAGATASRVITVRPNVTGTFAASGLVTSVGGDFDRTNNSATVTTTVN